MSPTPAATSSGWTWSVGARLTPTASPTAGSAMSAMLAPIRSPMPTPIAASVATWAKKWMKMRPLPAPMLRSTAMTLPRSAT
jgi:hypothetical protein